jgi:DNA processing protein
VTSAVACPPFERFATTDADLDAAIRLSALVWLPPRRKFEAALRHGTATAVLDAVLGGELGSEGDRREAARADAAAIRAAADATGASPIPIGAPSYPPQLASLPDPPLLLYVTSQPPQDVTRCVSIVGTRRASDAGREIATSLGRGLARAGIIVVSGAARGIDAAAHAGALDARGPTLAVLGCGVDQTAPNPRLIERIRAEGTLMSEFPPGTRPHPRHFPSRNRIVAGLSRATVVVEGPDRSGALIAAEHAMEFGRDVFAVPGAVTSPLSAATLRLIREGAGAIGGVDDLLADLGMDAATSSALAIELTDDERRALGELRGATLPDRVAAALGVTVVEALGLLMRLELRGLVRSVGGRFEATLAARTLVAR